LLAETTAVMEKISKKHRITIAFSTAAYEVTAMYNLLDRIKNVSKKVILEKDQGASAPFCCRMNKKNFDRIIVAPCTANTVAKIVNGIADTLVTNVVAQGMKGKIPVTVVPTDLKKKVETTTHRGKRITIHCRDVDLKNIKKLKHQGIEVVEEPKKIRYSTFKVE